ncbi:MAG: hypothetical protein KDC95_18630, partial [Planctomycetes bacterium]|nr:hypothetical protein [Planctomycetota bacterium]
MRFTRTTVFSLLLAATAAAQINPEIQGFEVNASGQPINPSGYGTLLDDDARKLFRARMDLAEGEYAFVFVRLWVEPAVVAGTAVGTAVVEAMQATHHNLQAPPTYQAEEVVLPEDYSLDESSFGNTIEIERERMTDFLTEVVNMENPELRGFAGDSTGT